MKISHKGLILVAVPLAFEIVFVVALAILLSQAEAEAEREAHARTVVSLATELTQTVMQAGSSMVAYRFAKTESFLKRYDECVKSIPEQVDELKNLTRKDKNQLVHVNKLDKCARNTVSLLTEYRKYMTDGRENSLLGEISVIEFRRRLQASFDPFMKEVSALQGEARTAQQGSKRSRQQNQLAWRYLLGVGVLINVGLAILLAVFFSRGITNRVAIVADNSRRLSNRAELHRQLGGSDEIAELDKLFHEMVNVLKRTEEERQQFFSMISHDLRSPLMNLKGTLTLFEEGTYGDITDGGRNRLLTAQKNLDRLIDMINQLLLMEKLEAGMLALRAQEVKVVDIVEQAFDSLRAIAEHKELNIEIDCPVSIACKVDRERIFQVIVNLLSNAIKFSPSEGNITVKAIADGEALEIRVIDEGPGISEEQIQHIFDRFYQTDAPRDEKLGGSGLGLAICKKIVELHKGEIGAFSKSGEGSTFWFKLPA